VCSWHGQRVGCQVDAAAVTVWRDATRAYDSRLADLTSRHSDLQAKVDAARNKETATGSPQAAEALAEARQSLDDELQQSVMHQLGASLFGVRVSDLSEDRFNLLKRYAVLGLAGAFSLLSAIVSIVAAQNPRPAGRLAGPKAPADLPRRSGTRTVP
jgi:hypothetical protein